MTSRNKIPVHWGISALEKDCIIIQGQSPPSNTYNNSGEGIPFFQGKADFTDLHPIVRKWCNAPQKIALPNDILLSVRAPVGTTNIADQKCCIGRGLAAIRAKNYKFVFYFLRSIEHKLDNKGTGTTFRAISGNVVRNISIPIPSASEQKLIVEKIEELFSELDAGRRQLEAVKKQIETYRQSVLHQAFSGRLVRTGRDLSHGFILSSPAASLIDNNFSQLQEGWQSMKLEEACLKIQDGSHFSPKVQYENGGVNRYKYITAKNIRNNKMDLTDVKYVDKEFHKSIYSRCDPDYGDVLLTKDGVNTGQVTLNTLHEPISLLSSVCIFKTKKDVLLSDFLKYFIQSPSGLKAIEKSMTGTAIKRIILRKIKDSEIAVPKIAEQVLIVAEIESRLSVCDKLEETIETCLQQSEALKQSILKQAFEGKLVK